jgi:hypothetical protein
MMMLYYPLFSFSNDDTNKHTKCRNPHATMQEKEPRIKPPKSLAPT